MRKILLTLTLAVLGIAGQAQTPDVSFIAREAVTSDGQDIYYYHCGFDNDDEFDTWLWETTTTNANYQFKMWAGDYVSQVGDRFRYHNPASTKSLLILQYSGVQDELGYSPEIEVQPGSTLGFWLCSGVATQGAGATGLNYYDFAISVLDVATNDTTLMLKGSEWIQQNPDYVRYTWRHVSYDLAAFAGRTVRLQIHYWAPKTGDLLFLDDFELLAGSNENHVDVKQGQDVHFMNYTTGSGLSYAWEFPGGQPETSTDESPIVNYPTEGTYDVRLTVSSEGSSEGQTLTQPGYVSVRVVAPTAAYAYPDTVYNRVGGGCYIPNNTLLTLLDNSLDYPTSWRWSFDKGANISVTTEQNPTVYYPEAGEYNFTFSVENKAGGDLVESDEGNIFVGETQGTYVWNIANAEETRIARALIGTGEGYYGGSNTRHIEKYAELFPQPQAEVTISRIGALFLNTTTFRPDTAIVVSIHRVGSDGMPGEELGRAEKLLGDVKQADIDPADIHPAELEGQLTEFVLADPVTLNEPYFVVLGGIPPYELDHMTKYLINETYLGSLLRSADERNTSYVYADSLISPPGYPEGTYLGWSKTRENYKWRVNTSTPISLAIAPFVTFSHVAEPPISVGIRQPEDEGVDGIGVSSSASYDLSGRKLGTQPAKGIILQRQNNGQITKQFRK